jgi:hypothetical protein
MRPAIGETNGTCVAKALPVCRAARDVSIAPIARSLPLPIDSDEMGSQASAKTKAQSESASGELIEARHHLRIDCLSFSEA